MELKNLQEYVERELGHAPEPTDLEERFVWLIQEYHSMKGELSSEDLIYINTIDPQTYDYLESIVEHYELHIMSGPGIEYEIEECYLYFSYDAAISDMEEFTKEGLYARLISVDTDCLFNNQVDIDNFDKVNQKEVK